MQSQLMGLINPAIAFLFAATFAMLWLRDRSARHVLVFAISYVLLGIGFLVFHYSPNPNGVVVAMVMHALYSGSVLCLCWAVLRRVGVTPRMKVPLAIVAVAAALMVATNYAVDQNPRLYAANACYGLLIALATQVLSRAGGGAVIDKAIRWLFGLTAAQFFVRPYLAIIASGPMSAAEYRDSVFYSVVVVVIAVLSLAVAMALVAACVSDQMEKLKTENDRDLLTGLRSRRAFERDAITLLDEAFVKGVTITAIVADIDHFKRVNDIWGHQAGDNAIAAFGRLLANEVRDTDCVGRIGGEEFCVLVWDCDGASSARLAERIRAAFSRLEVEGISADVRLTASFGVAERHSAEGYGRLFARADASLYEAKAGGRNRVEGPKAGRRNVDRGTFEAA